MNALRRLWCWTVRAFGGKHRWTKPYSLIPPVWLKHCVRCGEVREVKRRRPK